MKSLLLVFVLSFSFQSYAADTVISREQFVETMKTAIPNAFCSEKQYFRKCFKITEDECIKEAMRATKVCLISLKEEMPEKLHQPKMAKPGARNWALVLAVPMKVRSRNQESTLPIVTTSRNGSKVSASDFVFSAGGAWRPSSTGHRKFFAGEEIPQ
jgi:hypothetical protein